MKSRIQNLLFWLLLSAVSVGADQSAKAAAVAGLKGKPSVVLIPGVLELLYTENRGAAFGILQGRQAFFFVIAAAVLALACYAMFRLPGFEARRFLPLKICISLITAGAAGNMIDRITQGYVVDFIYFSLIDFPVFNVADIFVTCATFLLMLLFLFYYSEEELACLSPKKGFAVPGKDGRP